MTQTAREPHHRTIRVIQLCGSIVLALFFLGQSFFMLAVALILTRPQAQPPMEPVAQVVFISALAGDCILLLTPLLALQFWLPRTLKRKGKGFLAIAASYLTFKIMAWAAAEGMGFFALVCCLIKHSFWPFLPFSILSLILLAANPPLARVLRSTPQSGVQ